MESRVSKRYLYTCLQITIIHSSQKAEAIQVSVAGWRINEVWSVHAPPALFDTSFLMRSLWTQHSLLTEKMPLPDAPWGMCTSASVLVFHPITSQSLWTPGMQCHLFLHPGIRQPHGWQRLVLMALQEREQSQKSELWAWGHQEREEAPFLSPCWHWDYVSF